MHATLAQSFLSLTIVIALVTSSGWRTLTPISSPAPGRTRVLAVLAVSTIFIQLILGGWMRHSDSGLAIVDFPLSYGRVLPPTTIDALSDINAFRSEHTLSQVSFGQIWIHFAHRVGALLAFIAVLAFVVHVLRNYKTEARMREPAIVLAVLLLAQIMFGALTVWTGKGVQVATTHVAVGALLFGTSVFLALRTFALTGTASVTSQIKERITANA
jgi:cytochrome c oxidase assembly protein subunit 15